MKTTLTLCALSLCGAMSLQAADEKKPVGDKPIPKQEEMFKKIDADGDGKLTQAEFMAFPAFQQDTAKAEGMWKHISNGKEAVTLAEFLAVVAAGEKKDKQLNSAPETKPKAPATASSAPVTDPEAMRKRLTDKVALLRAGMQKWAESGRDPSALGQTMQEKFKPLIEAGKPVEAETVLDRLLQELQPGNK